MSKLVVDELEPLGVKQAFSRKLTVDDQATIVTLLDIYQLESETEDEHEALLRTSDAFILMYNVTSPYSFQDTVAFLREIRRATSSREPVIVLAANQIDRPAQDHEVPHQDGVALAKELGCSFTETSAKTGLEVDATVINLVRALRAKKKGEERRKKNSLGLRVWKLVSRAR
ncbi:hypothetical protein MIND_00127400 [Mycena indigotica]|uniref:Uncharacterized protein n=1 Tax=Mycena indigotica TaxID=2126181 RepID=A0A8H6TCK9_9AGAR|nr:uncharacterized protein MIND_00127400 [Mycena indigotica]KAF7316093.1 hypothetical protein MIND_00127400 [Mycena indigotica]